MNFQDNLDTISGKVAEAAQLAAQKAKDLAMIARAKVQIAAEEDKIRKAQIEIGKLCYRDFMDGAEPQRSEYLPWYEKITECKLVIDELNLTIEAVKNSAEVVEEEDDVAEAEEATEEDFADAEAPVIEVEVVGEDPETPAE